MAFGRDDRFLKIIFNLPVRRWNCMFATVKEFLMYGTLCFRGLELCAAVSIAGTRTINGWNRFIVNNRWAKYYQQTVDPADCFTRSLSYTRIHYINIIDGLWSRRRISTKTWKYRRLLIIIVHIITRKILLSRCYHTIFYCNRYLKLDGANKAKNQRSSDLLRRTCRDYFCTFIKY